MPFAASRWRLRTHVTMRFCMSIVYLHLAWKKIRKTSGSHLDNRGRLYSVTEVAICENVGQDCGNGTIALHSTEKTIEEKKKNQLIGIWTAKTGFSLEKVRLVDGLD
ncbi:hypothetical protein AVEN_130345-1 [Araneus ventricosus]|uniref:Uncharacterized protein n=1 Tax=Araneus ventricosus TaxID=182803 RepID=A0A4Y2BDE7_ARAVE|nr:hypothetical protein AVEN_130345-1 [Araneus ventricosus]